MPAVRSYMSKRQRACDLCRIRKSACRIEQEPPCNLCRAHGSSCTFDKAAPVRKHGSSETQKADQVPTNDRLVLPEAASPVINYVPRSAVSQEYRGISSFSGAVDDYPGLTQLPDAMDYLDQDHQSEMSLGGLGASAGDSNWMDYDMFFGSPGPVRSAAADTMSTASVNIDHELEMADPMTLPDFDDDSTVQNMGLTCDMEPRFLQMLKYDTRGRLGVKKLSIQSVSPSPLSIPTNFLITPKTLSHQSRGGNRSVPPADEVPRSELFDCISMAIGERLIRLFHQYIAPHYPIFAEDMQPNPLQSPVHLLSAIYLVTQPFVKFDDRLSIDLAYDKPPPSALTKLIFRGLENAYHAPDIALVQTLLLLVVQPSLHPVVSDAPLKWSLLARLVAAAQTIGLQLDPTPWSIGRGQIALRRRLSFSVYSVDKWLASTLGQPPLINATNWLVTSLSADDEFGSGLSPAQWVGQRDWSDLSSILDAVLSELYSLRALQEINQDVSYASQRAEELLIRVIAWQDDRSSGERSAVGVGTLSTNCDLGYTYVSLLIYSAALPTTTALTASETQLHDPVRQSTSTFTQSEILKAISSGADLIRALNDDHCQVFWPRWSQVAFSTICFLLLRMALTSPDFREASERFQDLLDIRRQLRLKASMLPLLRLGLLRIDSIFWLGPTKVLKMDNHVKDAFIAVYGS